MTKIMWYDAIRKAFQMFIHRDKYAYFYSCKGQKLTDEVMNSVWNSYPDYFKKYTAKEKKEIFNNSRNKIGYDCSGFVAACIGDWSYSLAQKEHSKPNKSVAEGKAGSILFTTAGSVGRHIMLDTGLGTMCHMGCESTDANVKAGKDSVCFWRISECPFPIEYSGESNFVDYTGSSAK